jgi:hypothetical protein
LTLIKIELWYINKYAYIYKVSLVWFWTGFRIVGVKALEIVGEDMLQVEFRFVGGFLVCGSTKVGRVYLICISLIGVTLVFLDL